MKSETESVPSKKILLSDYKAPEFSVKSIRLHFDLAENRTMVTAIQEVIRLEEAPLILNGESLKLQSVKIDGRALGNTEYELGDETLIIRETPKFFLLETVVEINPEANKSCEGLYLSKGIFATQCEAEGFRHITYFLDRPDVMTSYTVTIEADRKKYPVLLSNGDLVSKKDLDGGRHQAVWADPYKKPSYLFALVAGDLGVVTGSFKSKSGKDIKLEVYASHGKQDRCHHALESLKKAMKWDEERFGLEYDLGQYMIVSIDDFNMGAMENKGLNIFNSRLVLANPESATDTDFDRIESVVGHEYFHNWTGNRVTCRNWFELSLKEGLTVFRDQEFSADLNSRAVQRIKDVDSLRISQFTEDAGPNSHPVRPESCLSVDNFYTSTIYEKGAEVIRMMQTIVGAKGFRAGMDEYFKRHDGQAVTILDFADAVAAPNKTDLEQFKLWYSQSGTPEVTVTESYDHAKGEYTLSLKQFTKPTAKQPHKKPFHIPLLVGLLNPAGQDMHLKSGDITYNTDEKAVLHLKHEQQTFVFTDVSAKPVLSLNREFSAPIKLHWQATQAELLHLIKFDSDSFNRREAVFKMALQEQRRLISNHQARAPLLPKVEFIDALGAILTDSQIDAQFKALMLQLPEDEILAQEEAVLDAQAFFAANKAINIAFVGRFESELINLYFKHHQLNSRGDRALKGRILRFLVDSENSKGKALAFEQFNTAKNMTDTVSALFPLANTSGTEKEKPLQAFFDRWKDDAVVFNKWLVVQAAAQLAETFETVKKLAKTPPFNFENPNNIYSLHSVFADNYLALQRTDGASFKWLSDEIIRIDKINPQVAARLCASFNFVKKYPPIYRDLAQGEIRRVLATPDLSKNSRELLEGCV